MGERRRGGRRSEEGRRGNKGRGREKGKAQKVVDFITRRRARGRGGVERGRGDNTGEKQPVDTSREEVTGPPHIQWGMAEER